MSKKKILMSFVKPQPYTTTSSQKGRKIQQSGFLWLGQPIQTFETSTRNRR